MSSKMGHAGPKSRSIGQILEKTRVHSRGHIFSLTIMKLGQNVCLNEILTSLKTDHVGLKTRSIGQSLEKPYVRSTGYIFLSIILILGQNLCRDEILDVFENGPCPVKN